MKKILLICGLLAANVLLFAQGREGDGINGINSGGCYSGGVGTRECAIDPGVKIGNSISGGCSVKCDIGYYACCGIGCSCIDNKYAKPTDPNAPAIE